MAVNPDEYSVVKFDSSPTTKIKIMNERKSKSIFIVVYISTMLFLLSMSSCGTGQLTQKQVKINYELDRLWIDYKYKNDSLINEFYKDECENCDEID